MIMRNEKGRRRYVRMGGERVTKEELLVLVEQLAVGFVMVTAQMDRYRQRLEVLEEVLEVTDGQE